MKDNYIKFTKLQNSKDIPGESLDSTHKDWIEFDSWSQEITMPKSATSSTQGTHTAERSEHREMVFEKKIDRSSASIYEAASAGHTYNVEIHFFRASGTVRTQYLTIKLTDAIISRVTTTVPPEGLPLETFALKYATVVWTHKGSKTDGTANVGNDVGGWSLRENKAIA